MNVFYIDQRIHIITMKGLKELPKNCQDQQADSENDEEPQSSAVQQSVSQSQLKSSDLVSVSNEYVHDDKVGYGVGNYKMEKINLRRWNIQKRCFEYLIKWKGFSNSQCTWQTTDDILRQPQLPLKDLGKNTMLPIYQRTHGKTLIWDEDKKKVVKQFIHNEKNLLLYGSKQLIDQMKQQMQELYGQKNSQQYSQKNHSSSQVKVELDSILSEPVSSQNSIIEGDIHIPQGYKIGNLIIEKLIYVPQQFELKISVCLAHNPDIKRVLTCSQMMKIHPQTALMCYKVKIATIKKWKNKFFPLN